MSIKNDLAQETYEFVHRGKAHLTWEELPTKYGKNAYRKFAGGILTCLKAEIEKMPNPYHFKLEGETYWLRGHTEQECIFAADAYKAAVEHIIELLEEK